MWGNKNKSTNETGGHFEAIIKNKTVDRKKNANDEIKGHIILYITLDVLTMALHIIIR